MKITKKHLASAAILSVFVVAFLVFATNMTSAATDTYQYAAPKVTNPADLGLKAQTGGGTDPRAIAQNLIAVAMGFLGIIAVGIILYAGFLWMTAGGEDAKVQKATKMLTQGVIGLILILSAGGVAYWVVTTLASNING